MTRVHRIVAIALGLFLVLHLGNHLALLGGTEAHLAVQALLRGLYRVLPVEIVLIALFVVQVALGVMLARKRWRVRGRNIWARAQLFSGVYIGLFLVLHLGAVFSARWTGVETDVHFAAAGFYTQWQWLFFAPYYTLAVAALFTHVGAALVLRGVRWGAVLPWFGLASGAVIVAGLCGVFG